MVRSISKLLATLIFLQASSIHASENNCTDIKEANKRLECFDSQFEQKSTPDKNSMPISTKDTSTTSTKNEKYIGNNSNSLFDWEGVEPFISKIKKIRSREKQRMVFLFENDQIWIQIEPRPQPFREGEQVSIKAGLMGGFSMRSESGAYTRIRRIQ